MKKVEPNIAVTYGVSSILMNIISIPVVMFIMGFSENITAAIIMTIIFMFLTYLLNYKKYSLIREEVKVSFIRVVVFDVSILILPYIYSMSEIRYGYIELTPAFILGIVIIPMV